MRRLILAVETVLKARQQRCDEAETRMDQWTREEYLYWYRERTELIDLWQQQRDDCLAEMQRRFPDTPP
jgi:hypothetical protein